MGFTLELWPERNKNFASVFKCRHSVVLSSDISLDVAANVLLEPDNVEHIIMLSPIARSFQLMDKVSHGTFRAAMIIDAICSLDGFLSDTRLVHISICRMRADPLWVDQENGEIGSEAET